jgi:hypothetical protein
VHSDMVSRASVAPPDRVGVRSDAAPGLSNRWEAVRPTIAVSH